MVGEEIEKGTETTTREEAAREALSCLRELLEKAVSGYSNLLKADLKGEGVEQARTVLSAEEAEELLTVLGEMIDKPGEKRWDGGGKPTRIGSKRGKVIFGPALNDETPVIQLVVGAEEYLEEEKPSGYNQNPERIVLDSIEGKAYSLMVTTQEARRVGGEIEGKSSGVVIYFDKEGDVIGVQGVTFVGATPHFSRGLGGEFNLGEEVRGKIPPLLRAIAG